MPSLRVAAGRSDPEALTWYLERFKVFYAIGRLRDGVSLGQAALELSPLAGPEGPRDPAAARPDVVVTPVDDYLVGAALPVLWLMLAAVVLEGADPALLDVWGEERRRIFLERTSPQACAYKDFVFHACGGGARLEERLEGMRAMVRAPDVRLQRLMFTKGLETTSPAER